MADAWQAGEALQGIADLDLGRAARRGYPEAVYCEGKTPGRVGAIVAEVGRREVRTLFTRATAEHAAAVLAELPDATHDETARLLAWPAKAPEPTSVGYRAAFEGLASLLTMLNSCAPGVAVVNIDTGYGAGHMARPRSPRRSWTRKP